MIQTGSSPVLQFLELRNCRSLGEQPHDMRVDGFSTQTPRCNNNNKLVPSLSKKSITHYHQYQFHHLLLIFFIFYNPIIRTDSYLNTDFSNQILNYFLPCYLLSASGFNPLHFIFNISFHPIIHNFVWSIILQSQPCSTTILSWIPSFCLNFTLDSLSFNFTTNIYTIITPHMCSWL